jgi:hypothetical protein
LQYQTISQEGSVIDAGLIPKKPPAVQSPSHTPQPPANLFVLPQTQQSTAVLPMALPGKVVNT